MEHRWGRRIAVRISVSLRTRDGALASGLITELSVSGAHIATRLRCPPLARIEVRIRAAHPTRRSTTLPAMTVRRTAQGIGIEWLEFAAREVRVLMQRPAPAAPAPAEATSRAPVHAPAA